MERCYGESDGRHPTAPLSLDQFLAVIAGALDLDPSGLLPEVEFLRDLGFDALKLLELVITIDGMGAVLSESDIDDLVDVSDAYFYYTCRWTDSNT
jgi:hypothetical protein